MQLWRVSKTNMEGPNTSVVHCVCACVWNFCFWALWCNYVFSLMPPNLFFIIIMLFSNEHSLVFWIKKNIQFHTMEYLVVLCVLGWVCPPLLERVNTVYCVCVCVCVCVWVRDEAQRGVKTSDGVSLVVLPELFSTWGNMCVNANTGYHGRPQSGRLLLCFSYSVQTHISKQRSLFWVTVYEKKGMYRCVLIKRTLSSAIERKLIWPLFALFNPVVSFCEFDRRNKQAIGGEKKRVGRECMNVWSFLVKPLTAPWVYTPVKWFVAPGVFFCFLRNVLVRGRKIRTIL